MTDKHNYSLKASSGILGATLGWSLANVGIAYIGRGQLITWIYTALASLFLFVLQRSFGYKFSFKGLLSSFPFGLTQAIIFAGTFYAFQLDNPGIAMTIVSFGSVLGLMLFSSTLNEELTFKIVLLAIVGAVGVLLISLNSLSDFNFSKGAIYALLTLPASASATFMLRHVQKKVPPYSTGFYSLTWVALIFTFILPFINARYEFSLFEVLVIVFLVVTGALGHFLYGVSQKLTTYQENIILSRTVVPLTAFFSWVFLGSSLKIHQIVGMVIVLVVALYVPFLVRREKR